MFGGGGGINPRKMEQMMKQMGVDVEELDAEEVIIRTEEYDLVFDDPDVTKIDARSQETYQIIGSPDETERGARDDATAAEADQQDDGDGVPDDDVELVAARTGVGEAEAREALANNDGDLAAAVDELE